MGSTLHMAGHGIEVSAKYPTLLIEGLFLAHNFFLLFFIHIHFKKIHEF